MFNFPLSNKVDCIDDDEDDEDDDGHNKCIQIKFERYFNI